MVQNLITQLAVDCSGSFFGIPSWHKYLYKDPSDCSIGFSLMKNNQFNGMDALLIGLAIVDILIRIAALVAVAFVLYGGIKYITSQGSPENTKAAQNTILNAVIGLVVAILAATIVAFVGRSITATP